MNSHKILIVEDEALIAKEIEILLNEIGYTVVCKVADILEAKKHLEIQKIDLALVDINLNRKDEGIQFARYLSTQKIPFIYVTSYSDKETVQKALQSNPDGYILKPVSKEDLFTTIETVMNRLIKSEENGQKNSIRKIILTNNNKKIPVLSNDIYWIKSDGIYLEIETTNKKYLERNTFQGLLAKLNDPDIVQVHRCWYVNINHIREFTSKTLVIKDQVIPISRSYKNKIKNLLNP